MNSPGSVAYATPSEVPYRPDCPTRTPVCHGADHHLRCAFTCFVEGVDHGLEVVVDDALTELPPE